ncbi:kinase-like domain-containing protein [Microdochium trichocladiopsis]|uniref:Kinase-like domain-containing protein n=1 Tax=Microdochium trichocladiopsis TaxID=1682393 RepID=A0A9P8YCE1_9PEZI|nr:kinase-like domain-containing protein [Microdochium trichocladiopsis]KAH7035365.1 kinase-like domain-containing protein [Microdochium trichocladiopsis]
MADRVSAAKHGLDSDALTPRDVNVQRPPKAQETAAKVKAALASKQTQKDKEHPPPPPPIVYEPPSSDRKDGASYQVGKMLGKGGFAICYEGYLNKKRYALKIVRSKMAPKMEQKFQTELQIHSKMRHQNIVHFLRAFSADACTYLVLELCPNGSLMDMVKRRKGLTEPEVRFYSIQIAGAIRYMHSKGIIHRDLKMGNIFLDRQMNAKIGDFGLAALLVTGKDMQTIRRTTLCGTPNYIAPEILEKGKKGHDHMVDLWSLGIIMFAMLTSKPPFQSSTTDEIYRRARNRDYEWPTPETSNKYISQEAKDLVASMLEEPDHRPEPDVIVQHDFFLSGHIPTPEEITPKLRDYPPDAERFYATELTPQMASYNLRILKDMCRACEVGPWAGERPTPKSTWREMALEEKAGLTPIIPLAEGIVYRPFDEVRREQRLLDGPIVGPMQASVRHGETSAAVHDGPSGLLRAPPQSFAAQQRAQNKPAKTNTALRSQTMAEEPTAPAVTAGSLRTRARRELNTSSTANDVLAKPASKPTVRTSASRSRPIETRTRTLDGVSNNVFPVIEEKSSSTERIRAIPEPSQQSGALPAEPPLGTLFGPDERRMSVPTTKPDIVLERLSRLQAELERALNSRSMAVMGKSPPPSSPHIVVKWVDYSNKFGLGYILNDGGVGCVLRSIPGSARGGKTVTLPPSCILVREAEQHCARRHDPGYPDRHQIVPMANSVQFYENNGAGGISTVFVNPSQFRITINEDGTPSKVPVGRDIYDYRKRELLILWKKFANYMMAYGRDQEVSEDSGSIHAPKTDAVQSMPPSDVVTFYQRIGDVGCWVFADGHSQFNFPDHTKIVLDAEGTWCHFWHLPQEAAEKLAATGELDESALDDRAVLSYPLQTLLNFATKPAVRPVRNTTRKRPEINPMLQGIPAANHFRQKIEFIRGIIREWVMNGGIGNSRMSREHRQQWTGCRETVHSGPSKHVWVTIGARWGDERYSAMVDPKRPGELGEEVESKRSSS